MPKKMLALILAVVLTVSLLAIPAAAADIVEVGSNAEMDSAIPAATATTTIKMTKSLDFSYSNYENSLYGKHIVGDLPEGATLDLAGHVLTFGNAVIRGRIVDSVGGGSVAFACGNPSRFNDLCTLPVKYNYVDLVRECRISSDNVTNESTMGDANLTELTFRVPENIKLYANKTINLTFDSLTLGSGTTMDLSMLDVKCKNDLILEAAKPEDLSFARMLYPGVTKIVLTADISDPNLNVLVPTGAMLDYNGHILNVAAVNGATIDSAAAPATPATPAEPATPGAPTTPAEPVVIVPAPTTTTTAPATADTKYTVKDGDCLYAIARALMGGGWNWPALYEANKAVIGSNPRLIYTGTVLTIPSGTTTPATPATPSTPAEPAAPATPVAFTGTTSCVLKSFDTAAKTLTLTVGNGWETFAASETLTIDDIRDPALSTAKETRQYTCEIKDGKVEKMTSLVYAQGYTSLTSTDANGNFKITNLKKNADGSYSFDVKNAEKNKENPGLTAPAGTLIYDAEGKATEPKDGDIIRLAHKIDDMANVLTVFVQERLITPPLQLPPQKFTTA